jgi:hypothetical protein
LAGSRFKGGIKENRWILRTGHYSSTAKILVVWAFG